MTSRDISNICLLCSKFVSSTSKNLECAVCKHLYHFRCTNLLIDFYDDYKINSPWYCKDCIITLFPFNHIESASDFRSAFLAHLIPTSIPHDRLDGLIFNPFVYDEGRVLLNDANIDPDNNFFNNTPLRDSTYLSIDEATTLFKCKDQIKPFIFMHLNCQGINNKLSEISLLLTQLNVSVLAVTETWLDPERASMIYIHGYKSIFKCRSGRRGGGVGFFLFRMTYRLM